MNLSDLDESVLKNLPLWLNIPSQKLKALGEILPECPTKYYENILDCQVLSLREGLVRSMFGARAI